MNKRQYPWALASYRYRERNASSCRLRGTRVRDRHNTGIAQTPRQRNRKGRAITLALENDFDDFTNHTASTDCAGDEMGDVTNLDHRVGWASGQAGCPEHGQIDQVVAHEAGLTGLQTQLGEQGNKRLPLVGQPLGQTLDLELGGPSSHDIGLPSRQDRRMLAGFVPERIGQAVANVSPPRRAAHPVRNAPGPVDGRRRPVSRRSTSRPTVPVAPENHDCSTRGSANAGAGSGTSCPAAHRWSCPLPTYGPSADPMAEANDPF